MNPTTLGLVTGLGAAVLLGYCVYFDRKRRSAPDFKAKLREKRRMAAKKAAMSKGPQLPDLSDNEAIQRFFLQEVQMGEELLGQGDIEGGVEHLALAVSVCGQPHSLLNVLQQTLPAPVFSLLLQSLDLAQKRISSVSKSSRIFKQSGGGSLDELE